MTPLAAWGVPKLTQMQKQGEANYATGQLRLATSAHMPEDAGPAIEKALEVGKRVPSQDVKKSFSPAQPDTGPEQSQQKPIQTKGHQQPNKGSEDLRTNLGNLGLFLRSPQGREELLKLIGNTTSTKAVSMEDPRALRWLRMLSNRPRVLILGGQGTGKSCLAFWLLEIMRGRGRSYVYRLAEEGRSSIPEWLGIIQDLSHAPPGSIVLVDEAYLSFFSRDSQTRANREITKMVNLSRQKDIGLIFVAHESRHLEKSILSGIYTLVVKKPAPLQVELDRSFLRPYLLKAQRVFQGKTDVSVKIFSYVCFSPSGFQGMLENPKPSFWSEKLSHIFASGNLGKVEKPAQELTREEKKERARKLHDYHGYSYGEIAKQLGVGKTTVYHWLNDMSGVER